MNIEGLKEQRLNRFSDIVRDFISDDKTRDVIDDFERKINIFEKLKEKDGVDLQRKTFPIVIAAKKLLINYGVMSYVPTRNEDKVFRWIDQLEVLDKRVQ